MSRLAPPIAQITTLASYQRKEDAKSINFTSGVLSLSTMFSIFLVATITLMGWANGEPDSNTDPLNSEKGATELTLPTVETLPQPSVSLGTDDSKTKKPFIMVVKTDQEEGEYSSGIIPSEPNQFMLPLNIDCAYDFTVDWGDGSNQVIRSPMSDNLVKFLNKEITTQKGDYFKLEEVVAYLRKVTKAPIVIDPKFAERLKKQYKEDPEGSPFLFFNEAEKMKLRDVLYDMNMHGFYAHFNKRDESIIISDGTGERGDLFIMHTYEKAGTYTIKVSENIPGGFPAIQFKSQGDCGKLLQISQWGDGIWSTMEWAFGDCINLSITATDTATARTETVTNFSKAWAGCGGLTSFPLLNTTAGTDFSYAWSGCCGLTNFPLLNTAAGTNFNQAWYECYNLTSFPVLDTSSGTDFGHAWSHCDALTSFPMLNTAVGKKFNETWRDCSKLTNFPLLNTAAGTDFTSAWSGCSSLTSFPLLNTAAGTNFAYAWSRCRSLTSFPLLNTGAGTIFAFAWNECSNLTSFPLLNTVKGEVFEGAWSECENLNTIPLLDLAKMKDGSGIFYNVTLDSDSYDALLNHIATSNKTPNIEFDGGKSKVAGAIGIQAREKLTKKLGWTIYDGDNTRKEP